MQENPTVTPEATPKENFEQGMKHLKEKDTEKATYYLDLAYAGGYAEAQFLRGTSHHTSYLDNLKNHIKSFEDLEIAKNNYQMAADQGHQEAECQLIGIIYDYENKDKGFQLYKEAAEKGNQYAQYTIGALFHYDNGDPFLITNPANIREALKYYEMAANQGSLIAKHQIGCNYGKIQRDSKMGLEYSKPAADLGNADAQLLVGCLYDQVGDSLKSFHYLTLAANRGNKYAVTVLKYLYTNNKYFDESMIKSIKIEFQVKLEKIFEAWWCFRKFVASENPPHEVLGIIKMLLIQLNAAEEVENTKAIQFMVSAKKFLDKYSSYFSSSAYFLPEESKKFIEDFQNAIYLTGTEELQDTRYLSGSLVYWFKNKFELSEKLKADYLSEYGEELCGFPDIRWVCRRLKVHSEELIAEFLNKIVQDNNIETQKKIIRRLVEFKLIDKVTLQKNHGIPFCEEPTVLSYLAKSMSNVLSSSSNDSQEPQKEDRQKKVGQEESNNTCRVQ